MKSILISRVGTASLLAFLVFAAIPAFAAETAPTDNADSLPGVRGGLVVQLGGGTTDLPAALSRSGRYVVNVLERDDDRVNDARIKLRATGYYGMASVDRIAEPARLPYTENLVNALVVENSLCRRQNCSVPSRHWAW